MQRNLDKVVSISKRLALFLNIKKCVSLHVTGKTPVGSRNTTFYLDGQPMRYLVEGELTMFLGKPVGSNFLNPVAALKDMIDLGLKIVKPKLAPWQRIDALKTFFYSSLPSR
jgi:hypothetical protein